MHNCSKNILMMVKKYEITKNCLLVESGSRNWLVNILNGEIVEIEKGCICKTEVN